jgi:prepilin-type N-terminal cleavage/methylation domain-containing protein
MNSYRKNQRRRRPAGGFTLIELLTVVAIIGILVALTVGVGMWVMGESARKDTQARMALIMGAVEAYHEAMRTYPGDNGANAEERCENLFAQLMDVDDSREKLADVPPDAMEWVDQSANPPKARLLDGYDNVIDYSANKGGGGTPVLVSPGEDGDFETNDDNLRSDKL